MSTVDQHDAIDERDIAIIGMAGRFPGARDLRAFWDNLREGREAVTILSDEQLRAAGVPEDVLRDPSYVKAATLLEDVEQFDAGFFGYTPKEAELLDPQQRFFLETAWHALEDAGYVPATFTGAIGIYAGVAWNTYLLSNLTTHPELFEGAHAFQVFITNDKDFMPTRVSYKLNLKGPSVIVQTSCSTSLVAVHLACQSLLDFDCDIALVGGVSIRVPQIAGYGYQEGGLPSPDGHCRAFDARAEGTIFGSGIGVVALKRLQDALDDGDAIYAVIKGSAINNDGSLKVSYTAPSVDGQAEVIAAAQAVAQVDPDSISYIEAHGTATALGDPIEVAALTKVFRTGTQRQQFCAIGSVKTNLGHLDAAAGVAGLIKTTLALKHRQLPPSLHYETPNPKIDFASSPFYVNAKLNDWTGPSPLRAGVSSFGVGGTNAHVILQEAPAQQSAPPRRPWQLLVLSARSEAALEAATERLAGHLRTHPDQPLADVAYTLQLGRQPFEQRRIVVCRAGAEAAEALAARDPERIFSGSAPGDPRPVAFMFPGQGAQYVGMGRDLYASEPVFRAAVDRCAALLRPQLGLDLRGVLYPQPAQEAAATEQLTQTALAQPALFVIEYALAQLWQSWGVKPVALIGHSIGEYVAATLAGVFTLEDALRLVATRGQLMQRMPAGAMLAVPLPEAEILPLLHPEGTRELSLAAINSPSHTVVSGPEAAISALEERLRAQGSAGRRLHTSHAFHSAMMEPLLPEFEAAVRRVRLSAPTLPLISNVSGTWLTPAEATDPAYWTHQLRAPVRFAAGLDTILGAADRVLLEVGPGTTLSTFARRRPSPPAALTSLRHPQEQQHDGAFALLTVGKLWLAGAAIDWRALHGDERRLRVSLPGYAFDHQRFWIEPRARTAAALPEPSAGKRPDPADWCYLPAWQRTAPPRPWAAAPGSRWLVFTDSCGLAEALAELLQQAAQHVIRVAVGAQFARLDEHRYTLDPRQPADYRALLATLAERDQLPERIIHLWTLTDPEQPLDFDEHQARGCLSLLQLAQALADVQPDGTTAIEVVSNGVQRVAGEPWLEPAKATLLGPCKVIPQEQPGLRCRSIDVTLPTDGAVRARLVAQLLAEFAAPATDGAVAYRDNQRWVQRPEPLRLEANPAPSRPLRPRGVYLVTGGLSGIGYALAGELAEAVAARLVLIEDTPLPERAAWSEWRAAHDEDDPASRRIRRIEALEARGAEVALHTANLADGPAIAAVIAETTARWGTIHGLIHAAGLDGAQIFRPVQETTAADLDAQLTPKARGLLQLHHALRDTELDWALLVSSLAGVLGGRGYAAYAAANLFLDAFAQQQARTAPGRWISVDWDAWALADEQEQATALSADLAQLALSPAEGGELFRHIVTEPAAEQIVVSTADLRARIAQWSATLAARREQAQHAPGAAAPLHPRPQLATTFAPPESELEQGIARIWQRALGFAQIGVHDNFFELGGDSFIAIQVVTQLKKELGADVPAVKLYQGLTIRALAELISRDEQAAAQQRSAQLTERREQMDRRKQYQQLRRTRK